MAMKRHNFMIWSKKVKTTKISDTKVSQYKVLGFLITHDYYNVVPQYKDTLYCACYKQCVLSSWNDTK